MLQTVVHFRLERAGMGMYGKVRERWLPVVESWRSSGLGAAEFCRREGLPVRRFYQWRKRLSAVAAAEAGACGSPGFVQVRFPEAEASGGCGIAVVVGPGVRLELSAGFDAGELARAVRALGGGRPC